MLSWNLMHGRAVPPAGRDLFECFAQALAGWDWDVALLQEVPPWWPQPLAARFDADHRMVLTSRNSLLPLRRAIAIRRPDLIKSNGGGANAILVRPADSIAEHRMRRLRLFPERRWVHAVRLHQPDASWIGNLHAGGSRREALEAAAALLGWAGESPCMLGGDFNLPEPELPGLKRLGGEASDHFFARGFATTGAAHPPAAAVLEHGPLSDHAPLLVGVSLLGTRPA